MNLKEEYEKLDSALSYWGEEDLHKILKSWYDKLDSDAFRDGGDE